MLLLATLLTHCQLMEAIKSNPTLVREAARLKKLGIDVGSIVTEAARESQLARGVRQPLGRFA